MLVSLPAKLMRSSSPPAAIVVVPIGVRAAAASAGNEGPFGCTVLLPVSFANARPAQLFASILRQSVDLDDSGVPVHQVRG